jgi:RNA polymerase sigma-B factor
MTRVTRAVAEGSLGAFPGSVFGAETLVCLSEAGGAGYLRDRRRLSLLGRSGRFHGLLKQAAGTLAHLLELPGRRRTTDPAEVSSIESQRGVVTCPPERPSGQTDRTERTAELFQRASITKDDLERQRLINEVVVLNMGIAGAVAMRYRARGVPIDDLRQVAYLALVKAARGFNVRAGHDFLSYALPTIRGEVKRHFRDRGWAIRPPRRLQELRSRISAAESELAFSLGRTPRDSEVAALLGEPVQAVAEAMAAASCFCPTSLDRPGDDGQSTLGELVRADDTGEQTAEVRVTLAPVVRRLSERDRRILMLRFFRGYTQQEIADEIGVTQMQVSRLLNRILGDLRDGLSQPHRNLRDRNRRPLDQTDMDGYSSAV